MFTKNWLSVQVKYVLDEARVLNWTVHTHCFTGNIPSLGIYYE